MPPIPAAAPAPRRGVPPDAIRVEDQSADTWQNVELLMPYLRGSRIRVMDLDRYDLR